MDGASIAPETRREIWREERIAERVSAGEEYADGELERGDIADRADFGDETTVVVTDDQERFDVVDVPTAEAEDVGRGDTIRISRVGETTLEKQEDRDRGLDR